MAIKLCLLLFCSLSISVTANHCLTCTYGPSACHLSDAYANCKDCPDVIGDVRSDINSLVSTSNSVARRLCRLTVDKAQCLLATDTVNNILEELTNQMFPKSPSESSKRLTCGHLLFLCPDVDSKGKELEDGSWSCASCETFLDYLFTVLNTPLPKLNEAMSTILCPAKDSDCLSAFTDVFQVSGLLGDFIKDKRTATAVCKVLKCIN
ncbi:hypothetical protein PRIPAC_88065 [Pristionchus pacificus]|uniref:Uncharacterized protein n=1 Tax=Pristionchus pacificus TaxID=54126 RepID=A0A2A6CX53_PRIPA|nr:hypothetical protein PRIPAC_88065 [Pristionchus pacificus]|eukprot:PDM82814.1 hypothetical protein PRIPAC_37207 [Pristionchus pacificus]